MIPNLTDQEKNKYILLWYKKIDNKLYLIDNDNNIYENNTHPTVLGYYYKQSIIFY